MLTVKTLQYIDVYELKDILLQRNINLSIKDILFPDSYNGTYEWFDIDWCTEWEEARDAEGFTEEDFTQEELNEYYLYKTITTILLEEKIIDPNYDTGIYIHIWW